MSGWSPFRKIPEWEAQAIVNRANGITCCICGQHIAVGTRIRRERPEPRDVGHRPTGGQTRLRYWHIECD